MHPLRKHYPLLTTGLLSKQHVGSLHYVTPPGDGGIDRRLSLSSFMPSAGQVTGFVQDMHASYSNLVTAEVIPVTYAVDYKGAECM